MTMKRSRHILAATLLLAAAFPLSAQQERDPSYWRIDWRPGPESPLYDRIASRQLRRYTLAVHPYHLTKEGLKFDLEIELREPGQWLQLSAMGYLALENKVDEWGERHHRWGTLASGFEEFDAMWGAGIGIGYKAMLAHRGLYFNAALLYNHYSVDHDAVRYFAVPQDGLTFYERRQVTANTRFHQPALTLSLGKHMALGRHAFLDLFMGWGYMHSLYSGPAAYTDPYAFGYRGSYFNAGLRLGALWHGHRPFYNAPHPDRQRD